MALPATDNFSADDIAANWTITQTGLVVDGSTHTCGGSSSAENTGYWSADAFTGNHYSQGTVAASGTGTPGVVVRLQGSAGTTKCYLFTPASGSLPQLGKLYKLTSGTSYSLLATVGNINTNDTIKLTVNGSTLETFINTVSQGTVTDSSITGGDPGFYCFGTTSRMDNFQADNMAGGSGGGFFGEAPYLLLTS